MKERKLPELKEIFVERMKKLLTNEEDFKKYLKILKEHPVRSLRCNNLKISPEELKEILEKKGWKISQPWNSNPEVMIVESKTNIAISPKAIGNRRSAAQRSSKETNGCLLEPGELGRSLEHLLGYYYIQELASMLPIIALKPEKNESLLDVCAAPGSKTSQAAAMMRNTGSIIANEISMGRLRILASNLERCGVTNAIITKKDGVALGDKLKKNEITFDKILVDAPCSGEGTLRSSPKTYAMWNIKTVMSLPKIQKQLFKKSFEILKVGGEIIYSTCTHAPEENEGVVSWALEEFKDRIKMEKIEIPIKTRPGITNWEKEKYNPEVKKACRVYPQDNNTEGFFLAKFKKIK